MELSSLFPELRNFIQLTESGQKNVYTAEHINQGPVVLKIVKDNVNRERILREIQAVNAIKSEFVPKIYETGTKKQDEGEVIYIIEERVDGKDLFQSLQEKRKFTTLEIVNLLETILKVLCELEKHRIVHRDIKPHNIILDRHGKFWIIDFGIARHIDLSSITNTNAPLGPHTVGYSPPEQFKNLKKSIDTRSDMFSLGITVYELITTKNPFRDGAKNQFDVYRKTEMENLPVLSLEGDTQNQLAGLISVLADKHISRRPRSAEEAYRWLIALKPTLAI